MATDESQPSTPVRDVPSEGLSSSPSVISSPSSSSASPNISAFLTQYRQAKSGEVGRESIDVQMAKKRKERDEAKAMQKNVRMDLKKNAEPKGEDA